jgi:preprotein translocase subunit Sec63
MPFAYPDPADPLSHLGALGVSPESSDDDIRQAWLDLVLVWHPDRFPDDPSLQDRAEQRLRAINAAYEALVSTPDWRSRLSKQSTFAWSSSPNGPIARVCNCNWEAGVTER